MNDSEIMDKEAVLPESDFHVAAEEVLSKLRRGMGRLAHVLNDGRPLKSRDLGKLLDVDPRLSWHVQKLTAAENPLSISAHTPAATSMRRLLQASRKRGVDEEVLDEVLKAFEEFEEFVERHAGDRATFDAMLSNNVDEQDAAATELAHRKAMFKSQCHLWGNQADWFVSGLVVAPVRPDSKAFGDKDVVDFAWLYIKQGLQRLRLEAPTLIGGHFVPERGQRDIPSPHEPIDPDAMELYGMPLLPEFCSQPIPALRSYQDNLGRTFTELAGPHLGRTGAVTLAVGEITRDFPVIPFVDGGRGVFSQVRFGMPTARVCMDIFVHRDSLGEVDPVVECYGDSVMAAQPEIREKIFKFKLYKDVEIKRRGIDDSAIDGVPQYLDTIRFTIRRMGFDPADFDVYRFQFDYPPVMSLLTMRLKIRPQ